MLADKLTGTGVALITPFKSNGLVDFEALKQVVNHVIEGGVDYVVAVGTTSEMPTLRTFECDAVIKTIIEEVDERVPIIVGVGGNNTAKCVEILKSADFSKLNGILSVVPYYNKPSQEGIFQHFTELAKASPVPIILYNIPSRCGVNMNADTTLRLANAYPNIVAIKEASGNMEQINDIIRRKQQQFHVISGDDALALSVVEAGGSGVISVLGNALPDKVSELIKTALTHQDKLALHKYTELLPLIELLFAEGNPVGIKAMLHVLGFCDNEIRLPLVKCSNELLQQIQTALKPFMKQA